MGLKTFGRLGDCALIPMTETASDREDFAPPTAQFAVREAKHLAQNVVAALQNRSLKNFHYSSKGSLASLGAGRGVAEVYGIKLTGRLAWLLWRVYYISFLPGMQTRISVLWNWLMDGFSPAQWFRLIRKSRKMRDMFYTARGIEFTKMARAQTGFTRSLAAASKLTGIDPATGEETSRVLNAGDHFGERLLIGATRRIATAVAIEDTKVLVLTRDEFLKLAEGLPFFRAYFETHLQNSGLGSIEAENRDRAVINVGNTMDYVFSMYGFDAARLRPRFNSIKHLERMPNLLNPAVTSIISQTRYVENKMLLNNQRPRQNRAGYKTLSLDR